MQAGEEGAWQLLYDRYEGPLYRFLLGILKDRHLAEDALQHTFVQVFQHVEAARAESVRGWLYAIAHQQAMLMKRKGRAQLATGALGSAEAVATADDPTQPLAQADDARLLGELLATLPDAQQKVIRLRIFEGLKFREVAERLGCPMNTALARLHTGLHALRQRWEAHHA
jgi:RNA polymerase sigma-70 factor (ECF subfamily)